MKPFIIAALLLAGFFAEAQQVLNFTSRLHTFKVLVDSAGDNSAHACSVKQILVYDRSRATLLQTITPPENLFSCNDRAKVLKLQDINFDGLTDFMIPQLIPASPAIPYYYWRFDKKKKLFERDTTLEDITSPNFNADQSITSFWRSSANGKGVSTYKYVDGQITLVEETESTQHPDSADYNIFTRKKLVNGKLILVERTLDKAEGEKGEKK